MGFIKFQTVSGQTDFVGYNEQQSISGVSGSGLPLSTQMKALGDLWPFVCESGDGLRQGFGFGLQGGQATSSLETPCGPHLRSNKRNIRYISIKSSLLKPQFLQFINSELKLG